MKKKIFICALLVICLSVLAYGSAAYFTAEGTATNVITAGNLHIALKECSETEYWLELLIESGYYPDQSVLAHCVEVKRILIASINTAKK